MITEYHETTGNTIYRSDDELFSSSNPSRVEEFERLGIKTKFDFKSTAQANQMLNWGHLPIAEAFLDDYNRIMSYFDTYYKKDVTKLEVRVSMREGIQEITQLVYKGIHDRFIAEGYTKCIVCKTGINTYVVGFDVLRAIAEKEVYTYEIVYSTK